MKSKIPVILTIAVLAWSVSACSSSTNPQKNDTQESETAAEEAEVSIEELISEAEILNLTDVAEDINANAARAEDYNDVWYVYTGKISSIGTDFCCVADISDSDLSVNAYLDKETLKELNRDDRIVLVGKFNSLPASYDMTEAYKLDNDTVKENLVFALAYEEGGIADTSEYYFDYVYNSEIGNVESYTNSGTWENSIHTLTYDENGNLIKDAAEKNAKTSYSYEDIIEYTYDESDTPICERQYTLKNGEITDDRKFELSCEKDEYGRITKKTSVNVLGDNYTLVYGYEYDDNGNVAIETQTSPYSVYTIEYEYDEFGNAVKEVSYEQDTPNDKSITEYEYAIIAKK